MALGLFLGPGAAGAQQSPATPATFTVFLDAAHGGTETGAQLSPTLAEKDLALTLSIRLRSQLTAHGITVVTSRESDENPPSESRAAAANRSHPAACLLLHATTSGVGVHLYTSALAAAAPPAAGAPRPWSAAQAAFLTQSLKLSSDVREALTHAAIPVTLGSVSMRPVDSMACPAVILELAPLPARRGRAGAALGDIEYQTRLTDALGGALEQWRGDWKAQP